MDELQFFSGLCGLYVFTWTCTGVGKAGASPRGGAAAGGAASVGRAGGTVLGRLSHGKSLVDVYHWETESHSKKKNKKKKTKGGRKKNIIRRVGSAGKNG